MRIFTISTREREMGDTIEQGVSRVPAEGRRKGGQSRWYCLPCGKSYKSKYSLERHEKTRLNFGRNMLK